MKKRILTTVACLALGAFSGALLAQPGGWDHDHDHDHHSHYDRSHHGDHGDRHHDKHGGMHDRGRHEGWYHKGGRVPVEYRSRTYIVTDWHRAHLREPRRGYHWVRSDNGDFLMVAIATGVIVDILTH